MTNEFPPSNIIMTNALELILPSNVVVSVIESTTYTTTTVVLTG